MPIIISILDLSFSYQANAISLYKKL